MNKLIDRSAVAAIVGNEDDGWNVVLTTDGYEVEVACESKEDAEDLRGMLNSCSWVEVKPQ